MTDRLLLVIAYDIADDARRADVSAVLAGIGARVQYSVFEVDTPPHRVDTLIARLKDLIDPADDQIRLWRLTHDQALQTTIIGRRRLEERSDFIIV